MSTRTGRESKKASRDGRVHRQRKRLSDRSLKELEAVCRRMRRELLTMLAQAGSGHPGGSLSAVEVVASLYFHVMNHDPKQPQWPQRDRFILSKGHGAPVLYAALALSGYFPTALLSELRHLGGNLEGHPAWKHTPGVEASTGSLGQGLSQAIGQALALRLDGINSTVFVLLGDGEMQEGMVWEGAMAAAHHNLGNLVGIVDRNDMQIEGRVGDVMNIEPLGDKLSSFGWHVQEIDGHDLRAVINALWTGIEADRPAMLIARTVKGKGVSFMENSLRFHGVAPTKEELGRALEELED